MSLPQKIQMYKGFKPRCSPRGIVATKPKAPRWINKRSWINISTYIELVHSDFYPQTSGTFDVKCYKCTINGVRG